jgi:septal ring factor EnvC (AmiA/AmiB activator)
MQSQLLIGGEKIQETPMFKNLVKQEHERVHRIYLNKLQELEKERQSIEEDKAQVDRYKQLLLKQRDIMIALTARLNERDEYIMNLQEELDAYDQHQKMLEDSLNTKNELISRYENALKSAGIDLSQFQLYNIVK